MGESWEKQDFTCYEKVTWFSSLCAALLTDIVLEVVIDLFSLYRPLHRRKVLSGT